MGDDLPALTAAVRTALERAPLVVVTGGLGPTADDLTRQALAAATDRPLELRPEILDVIDSRFAHRGREMPDQNRVQAMFPAGSRVIDNPHGTAPGIDLDWSHQDAASRLFALPGVPAEMIEMWEQTVRPAIAASTDTRRVICHRRVKCFGVGESQLESMLPDLIRRDRRAPRGDHGAPGDDHAACHGGRPRRRQLPSAACSRRYETIRDCLGGLVFGEEDDELEHTVVRLLETSATAPGRLRMGHRWPPGSVAERGRSFRSTAGRLVISSRDALQHLFDATPPAADQAALLRWIVEQLRARFPAELALAVGPLPEAERSRPAHFPGNGQSRRNRGRRSRVSWTP